MLNKIFEVQELIRRFSSFYQHILIPLLLLLVCLGLIVGINKALVGVEVFISTKMP